MSNEKSYLEAATTLTFLATSLKAQGDLTGGAFLAGAATALASLSSLPDDSPSDEICAEVMKMFKAVFGRVASIPEEDLM